MKHLHSNQSLEEKVVENLAQDASFADDDLPPARAIGRAKPDFVKFRTQNLQKSWEDKITSLNDHIREQKAKIDNYNQAILQAQEDIETYKAELAQLQQTVPDNAISRQTAEAEWRQIIHMRGVAQVDVNINKKVSKRKPRYDKTQIQILVKVRVPYLGELYDFGDYLVSFFDHHFRCQRVRSGVRLNHTNTTPVYLHGKTLFDFGPHESAIREFVENDRPVEALALIIERLHYVEPGDKKFIPGCYRKVSTIRRTRKRLQSEHKLKES